MSLMKPIRQSLQEENKEESKPKNCANGHGDDIKKCKR